MTDKTKEALKLALDWIEGNGKYDAAKRIAQTIREALAEECVCGEPDTPGTHRTDGPCLAEQPAQPLTGEQIRALWEQEAKPERSTAHFFTAFARAIEAAHGIKGDA